MGGSQFVHLHNHTEFSMLDDGSDRSPVQGGVPARDACGGDDGPRQHVVVGLYKQALKSGIKPIIGIEAYVAPESVQQEACPVGRGAPEGRHVRARAGHAHDDGGRERHRTAQSVPVLSPRTRASSVRARMAEILAEHSEDHRHFRLPSGSPDTVAARANQGGLRGRREVAVHFRQGHFFLELMDHGIDIERRSMRT